MEEERRKENMDKLRRDMEKSGGQSVVLSTGLKGKETRGKSLMEEDDELEEEEMDDDMGRYTEDDEDDVINEDDDEEVDRF